MYEYPAKVKRWVDGDTVDVDIDLGFDIVLSTQRIRLLGIDAPESRTRDLEEKARGLATKAYCKETLPAGTWFTLKTHKDGTGKYGRILGEILYEVNDVIYNLNEELVKNNLATPYFGGKKG
tara:strand:- start:3994 stop:4359 length:366 start_codon:yes stop_codon:yes gene_type:complete